MSFLIITSMPQTQDTRDVPDEDPVGMHKQLSHQADLWRNGAGLCFSAQLSFRRAAIRSRSALSRINPSASF